VPKKQRLRRFAHDRREAIKREIAKLLTAGFIKEVIHLEWVANPVLVRKKNNEWRMCVDYTDLNKHCPKDHFGLPRIDQVVDSTAGCVLLCFLDCYGDSLLVVQQVNKECDCNKETMDAYVQEVRKLENKFSGLEVHHVVREHNIGADILSKLGSTRA
jgi:hypothetical protein